MACGVPVLVFVLGYAVGYRTLFYRVARAEDERLLTVEKGRVLAKLWKPTRRVPPCMQWGKKYLGQGARVDNPDEW